MLTYATLGAILDGSDGRTYPALWGGSYIAIMSSDMKLGYETIWPRDSRYNEILEMIKSLHTCPVCKDGQCETKSDECGK